MHTSQVPFNLLIGVDPTSADPTDLILMAYPEGRQSLLKGWIAPLSYTYAEDVCWAQASLQCMGFT